VVDGARAFGEVIGWPLTGKTSAIETIWAHALSACLKLAFWKVAIHCFC
jgi:hypothetical protein